MPNENDNKTWWQEYKPLIQWAVIAIVSALVGVICGWECKPVPPPTVVERPVIVEANADGAHSFGWVESADQIAENLDPAKTLQFRDTPAGKAVLGDEDVFLYRAVRKVNNKGPPWYPNVNQQNVGCCVGCGFKHGADVVQATAIAAGQRFEWKPNAVEAIYAGSRVEVGQGRIRGDGSLGSWAAQWMKSRGGMIPMEKFGQYDLTTFSPARARQWGYSGVPDSLESVARQHAVKGTALVTSALDVKRAIAQGYPVAVCSNVGFNNRDGGIGTRDAQGFCVARGSWPHCMCFIGWRNGPRPGALCLNSWGDQAHKGPVWPEDMPVAAFWVDESTVDRMVRQGDSFALGDVVGFPARRVQPDWFVEAQPRPERFRPDRFAHFAERSLAW
jgi:hypothetical protein